MMTGLPIGSIFVSTRMSHRSASRRRGYSGYGGGSGLPPDKDEDDDLVFFAWFMGALSIILASLIIFFSVEIYQESHRHDGHAGHYENRQGFEYQTKQEKREGKSPKAMTYKVWIRDVCPKQ